MRGPRSERTAAGRLAVSEGVDGAGGTGGTTRAVVVVRPVEESAAVDVVLGLAAGATVLAWRVTRPLRQLTRSVITAAATAAPPSVTAALADRGRQARDTLELALRRTLQLVVPRVVGAVLANLDLTAMVREHVDLDEIAGGLDVAAVIDRVDLDDVVSRVDLNAVIGRVDLDEVVSRVDLDAVAGRLDLNAVASRLDLDRLVESLDIEAVLARIDLTGIAEEVIAAVDLPEIVRQSSGVLASEAVHGVRTGGMQADDAVDRFVDRLLRRRVRPAEPTAP